MGTPCIFQKECRQDLPAGRANTPGRRVELCIVRNHKAFIYPFRKRKKAGASVSVNSEGTYTKAAHRETMDHEQMYRSEVQ